MNFIETGSRHITEKYPNGVLLYRPTYDSVDAGKIKDSFPDRLVLFTQEIPWPADLSTQIGTEFFGTDQSFDEVEETIKRSVGPSVSIRPYLPSCVASYADHYQELPGAMTIKTGGGLDYHTIVDPVLEVKYLHYLPKLREAYLLWTNGEDPMARFDLDMLMTALQRKDKPVFFIDQPFYDHLGQQGVIEAELPHSVPVAREATQKGILNIPYIDGKAMVCNFRHLPKQLAQLLDELQVSIIGLEDDLFTQDYKAGPKCRSLEINWVRKRRSVRID